MPLWIEVCLANLMSFITAKICNLGLSIAIFRAVCPVEVNTNKSLATSSNVAKMAHFAIVF